MFRVRILKNLHFVGWICKTDAYLSTEEICLVKLCEKTSKNLISLLPVGQPACLNAGDWRVALKCHVYVENGIICTYLVFSPVIKGPFETLK